MPTDPLTMSQLAELVHVALQSADLEAYRELLDPDVTWGPPGDEVSGCHNRDEVLAWYRLGRDAGLRADVVEATVVADRILIGLRVHGGPTASGDEALRWQVLTVARGKVSDIRGFEDRAAAASWMS